MESCVLNLRGIKTLLFPPSSFLQCLYEYFKITLFDRREFLLRMCGMIPHIIASSSTQTLKEL